MSYTTPYSIKLEKSTRESLDRIGVHNVRKMLEAVASIEQQLYITDVDKLMKIKEIIKEEGE